MMRNTAISFTVCTRNLPDRINPLLSQLENDYKIMVDQGLELITIRHFKEATVEELTKGKIVLFEERLRDTIRMVVRDVPMLRRKEA